MPAITLSVVLMLLYHFTGGHPAIMLFGAIALLVILLVSVCDWFCGGAERDMIEWKRLERAFPRHRYDDDD